MEGQARVAGQIYKDVVIAGKTYRLSRSNLVGFYGDAEAWIISRKTDPLVLAVKACRAAPENMHATIWEAAMKTASEARIASKEEMERFWRSRWFSAFLLLKALDPKHAQEIPDMESAMRLIESDVDLDTDALMADVSVVNGEADIKNSSGLSGTQAQPNQQTETQPTEDGQVSTDSSQTNTSGLPNK